MVFDHTQQPPPPKSRPVHAVFDIPGDSSLRCALDRVACKRSTNIELGTAEKSASRAPDTASIATLVFGNLGFEPPLSAIPEYVRFGSLTTLLRDGLASRHSSGQQQRPLVTDGGQQESAENSQQQLRDLFCTVTGTDEVTEQQENDNRRVVAEEGEKSIAGAVAAVAREDGLDDTLPEPDGTD